MAFSQGNQFENNVPPPVGFALNPGYPPNQGYPPANNQPLPIYQQPAAFGQPQPGDWIPAPPRPPNCPPGLEYLTAVDQLLVHQKVELLEVLTNFETENKYTIKNSLGQKVYYAVEQSDCCTRNCCGPSRPFGMKILDNFQNEVIHLERPRACSSCCFPCCLQKLEVYSPPGQLVGTVEQNWTLFYPSFDLKNAAGETALCIEGPCLTFSCCGNVNFEVKSRDGESVVGRVTKQWSGLIKEMYTDADNFGITFPMDLDVQMKAVVLGACFLIDFMYFETTQQNNN